MKLTNLITSLFIFAVILTIVGLCGATAAFGQTQKHLCTLRYQTFLENRDGPEVHKLKLAVAAGDLYVGSPVRAGIKSYILCDERKEKEITDYIKKTAAIIKKEEEAGNAPTYVDLKRFCDDIFMPRPPQVQGFSPIEFSYNYEYRFWKLAGVVPGKDSEEIGVLKVQKWLEKYKRLLVCNENRGFSVPYGGLLKYAVHNNFTHLLDTFTLTYEVDINFVDLGDGKNVIDFIDDEIRRLNPPGSKPDEAVKTLQRYRAKYVSLDAKTSREVKKKSEWTAYDYFSSGNNLFREIISKSKDLEKNYQTILADYNKALEMDSEYEDVYFARAQLNVSSKEDAARLDSGIADMSKIIQLQPNHLWFYLLRADIFCKQGNKADSFKDREKALDLMVKVGFSNERLENKQCQ